MLPLFLLQIVVCCIIGNSCISLCRIFMLLPFNFLHVIVRLYPILSQIDGHFHGF